MPYADMGVGGSSSRSSSRSSSGGGYKSMDQAVSEARSSSRSSSSSRSTPSTTSYSSSGYSRPTPSSSSSSSSSSRSSSSSPSTTSYSSSGYSRPSPSSRSRTEASDDDNRPSRSSRSGSDDNDDQNRTRSSSSGNSGVGSREAAEQAARNRSYETTAMTLSSARQAMTTNAAYSVPTASQETAEAEERFAASEAMRVAERSARARVERQMADALSLRAMPSPGSARDRSYQGRLSDGIMRVGDDMNALDAIAEANLRANGGVMPPSGPTAVPEPPRAELRADTNVFRTTVAGRIAASVIGDPIAVARSIFRSDGLAVNPLSNEILHGRRLQDAKVFAFVDVATLGLGSTVSKTTTTGAKLVDEGVEAARSVATQAAPTPPSGLLPNEGLVGTYDELIAAGTRGDNLTPHHIPSNNRMAQEGVSKGDGLAINMEHPFPGAGGRHRETFTYGTQADAGMTARDALATGIRDVRSIYQEHGLYDGFIRGGLQDLIERSKTDFPEIFK